MKARRRAANRWSAWLLMLCWCLTWQQGAFAETGPLYVYTDAQGKPVLTDDPQQVPAEFRGRLRTVVNGGASVTNVPMPVEESTVGKPTPAPGMIADILSLVAAKVGSRHIKGFTAYQTAVVIVAGFCWLALLVLIFLSANPAIRLLSKCLLVLVGLAAVYHLALGGSPPTGTVRGQSQQRSEQVDNVMGQMKSKTEQSYRAQDERTARQLEPLESTGRSND